ncbi:THO complex subunit 3 [Thelohanellus kitauei]|uniref:THO complex subunit 3 n=1 Tax=Thelohanellus kitauei TaxID=669202 RepID=A0A0C2NAV3_THEKT|nr:THO complex subunit 3 [Thelohanellus kitauei]
MIRYPSLKLYRTLPAHPASLISIEFDPTGNADSLVSLWETEELACARVVSRLEYVDYNSRWPVRALSFSFDGKLLASASEDLFIDIFTRYSAQDPPSLYLGIRRSIF